jgi:glutathione peroxidase-family protein
MHDAPAVMRTFEKFLVGRDGTMRAGFVPDVLPHHARPTAAIEDAPG